MVLPLLVAVGDQLIEEGGVINIGHALVGVHKLDEMVVYEVHEVKLVVERGVQLVEVVRVLVGLFDVSFLVVVFLL